MNRIVFKNGMIIDGTSKDPFKGDVVIEKDKIVSVGGEGVGDVVIDVSGLIIAPGFIDIHSHSDYYLLIDPLAKSKVHQGVTTEIGGNCGYSAAPITGQTLNERDITYKEHFGLPHHWSSVPEYFNKLEGEGISLNYGHLIGSNTIRSSVMGFSDRAPQKSELDKMSLMITDGMDAGAFGLSFGIVYSPTCFAKQDELIHLAKVTGKKGGIITAHIRSEGNQLIEAIEEVICIAKEAEVALQISHLKTMGESNWKKIDKVFSIIESAIQKGVRVTCDRYPYIAANTGLQSILPNYVLAGGKEMALERISDKYNRGKISKEIQLSHPWKNYWDNVVISQVTTKKNKEIEGLSVEVAAKKRNKNVLDFFYDLLIDENMEVDTLFFAMNEDNLNEILKKDYVMIGSDAGARSIDGVLGEGVPHPRTFGTFPRILGRFAREKKLINLSNCIYKMTGAPSKKLGIKNRGLIKKDYFADITIFDPKSISDTSTFSDPKSYPVGIEYVFVNGKLVIEKGNHTGIKPGKVLKHV